MSCSIPIDRIDLDIRHQIIKDLKFQSPTTLKWIEMFMIRDDKYVMLPLYYTVVTNRQLYPLREKKQTYDTMQCDFVGTLRDYQKAIVKDVIGSINKHGSCVMALHVGWGKSIFAVYVTHLLKYKCLVIVNRLVLLNQWKDTINTVCPNATICVVNKKTKWDPNADFYLVNAINVSKFPYGYFSTIGTIIVDELHLVCAKTLFTSLQYITPRYLLGLSATPYRPDGLDRIIDTYFGPNRIEQPLQRLHYVKPIYTNIQPAYTLEPTGRINWNSLLVSQAENDDRNNLIVDIVLENPQQVFLILCKRINQGMILYNKLLDKKEHVTHMLESSEYDSEARVLIATTQKCGVGFSHNRLTALIMACDVEEYFIQYLGRVFRTETVIPTVWDIVDDHPVLKKHFRSRLKVYKQVGGQIK
jgi:superfamily II DNA or RNA helicase